MQTQNGRALARPPAGKEILSVRGPQSEVEAVQFFKWEIFCCQDDEERENEGQRAASALTHWR